MSSLATQDHNSISKPLPEPLVLANNELLPLLSALCAQLETESETAAEDFFRRIARSIERSLETEDLADPFLELSTSAFMGFRFSPAAAFLVDQILERAQQLAHTLSADTREVH